MDLANVSVNEFIRYWVKQNRKKHGYDWYEDRKETRSSGFVFEPTGRAVCTTAATKPASTETNRKADTGSTSTEELEIW